MEEKQDEEMENPISVRQLTRFLPVPEENKPSTYEATLLMNFFERLLYKRGDTISVESSDSHVSMLFTSHRDWGEARLPVIDGEPAFLTETRLVTEFFKIFQILVGNNEDMTAGNFLFEASADVVADYSANYLNILETTEKLGATFSKKAINDAFWEIYKKKLYDDVLDNWGVSIRFQVEEEKQQQQQQIYEEEFYIDEGYEEVPVETPLDTRSIDPAMVQKAAAEKMGKKKSHKVKFFAEDFGFPLDPFPTMKLRKITEKSATVIPKELKMFFTELLRLLGVDMVLEGCYMKKKEDEQVPYVISLSLGSYETIATWKDVPVFKSESIEEIGKELAAFEENAFSGMFDLLMTRLCIPPSVVSSLKEPKRVVTPCRQTVRVVFELLEMLNTMIELEVSVLKEEDTPWEKEEWINHARRHWDEVLAKKNESGRKGGGGGKRLPRKVAVNKEEMEKMEADVSSGDEYLPPPAKKPVSLVVEPNPDTDTSATPPPATPIAKKKAPKKRAALSPLRAPSSRATALRKRGMTLPCVPSMKKSVNPLAELVPECVDHLEEEGLLDQLLTAELKATETIYTAQSIVNHVFSAPYFKAIAAFFEALLMMTDMEMKFTVDPAQFLGKRNVKKGSSEVTVTFQTDEEKKKALSMNIPSDLIKGDRFEFLLAATFDKMRDEFVIDGETAAAIQSGLQNEEKLISLAKYTEKFLRCRLKFSED